MLYELSSIDRGGHPEQDRGCQPGGPSLLGVPVWMGPGPGPEAALLRSCRCCIHSELTLCTLKVPTVRYHRNPNPGLAHSAGKLFILYSPPCCVSAEVI